MLVYLEDTNLENGCTHVVPGSHILPDFVDLNDGNSVHQIALNQIIPVPMKAGELLAIDSMIIHSAGQKPDRWNTHEHDTGLSYP